MEFISLRTFKAIVDEGGIKGASVLLHTVPSNVTARIQKLEEELEVKLFKLNGRKLELTSMGELLYGYAQQILDLTHQARSAVQIHNGLRELIIGTTETFAGVYLPNALKELKQITPYIKPKIQTATSAELITRVLNRKIDCAFVGNKVINERLLSMPIVEEDLVIVEPKDGQYENTLIVREPGCGYRHSALQWQNDAGLGEQEVMTMGSVEGLLGCIAANLGYTIIGKGMVTNSRYESSLRTSAVVGPQTKFNIYLICLKDNVQIEDVRLIANLYNP